ncbi:thioredoxin-like protein [Hygrophoropsis aurantiaca]|uniref:Thioredoxin-like protein n=1 Tax=Hygrophoropsis aurantiaca TaxID=72124 RepID=A0ACB8ABX3_9AGAM|nr:thioredoxin-like protein [Hygrophoropsis aurantiaca]
MSFRVSKEFIHATRAPSSRYVPARSAIRQLHWSPRCQQQYFNANPETFDSVALNKDAKDKVVLVDFYAEWCQPCKMISPILENLTSDSSGVKSGSGRSLDLITVNTDEEFDLAQKYKIRALPTVVAFKDGQVVDQFVGALNEAGIKNFLAKV